MTIFGVFVSWHSLVWAWVVLFGFFWCLCVVAGKADEAMGRK